MTMTPEQRRVARKVEEQLMADPTIAAIITSLSPRQPRYRYFETPDGRMFLWTTERFGDGKYGSAVMAPYGPGSRSGKRAVTHWKPTSEVHHRLRKDAKDRAYRLYVAHRDALAGKE